MTSSALPNYLRRQRLGLGLSQADLARLLGCRAGSKVSRYERFARRPTLESAFAYEVIFGVPARDLFDGVYRRVEQATLKELDRLVRQVDEGPCTRQTAARRAALQRLADRHVRRPA